MNEIPKLPYKLDLCARSLEDVMAELATVLKHYPNARIDTELSYNHCYYESDTPRTEVWINSK